MLLVALFFIEWQECIRTRGNILAKYKSFAELLWNYMRRKGAQLRDEGEDATEPAYYQGDVGFVSLNYDPIALWIQFIANRELNKANSELELFQDFAHLIPARRIGKGGANWPWYPMNEGAAQRLNESASTRKIRLIKFLFPHGCLCWRECPNCRKLSAFHGDEWELCAIRLFPAPPLLAFDTDLIPDRIKGDERAERQRGAVDARACLHCGTLTYMEHTQTVEQSSFKSQPPSFVEEIQRDMRATTMRAKHILFLGYSLPADDVDYRTLFAATRQRGNVSPENEVRCTVVDKDERFSDWLKTNDRRAEGLLEKPVVKAAIDIFGIDNVRFYGGGIPNVFCDGERATDVKLGQLLNWSTVPHAPE